MLMEFSPVTTVDSWVRFLPKNTLILLLENELGKDNLLLLFYQTHYDFCNLQIIFALLIIY